MNIYSKDGTVIGKVTNFEFIEDEFMRKDTLGPTREYLAIPYSHESDEIMEARYRAATRIAGQRATNNRVVFSPITHSHAMAELYDMPRDWDFWRDQDVPFLDWADEVRVVKAHGWRESTGVQAEIKYAEENDMPVRYLDPVKHGMKVVGISGRKRSGKDHFADYLVEHFGFEKYPLAEPIKESAAEIFLFNDEQLYGDKKEEEDPYWKVTPRKVLQEMGTNFFREEFDEEVWTTSLYHKLALELPRKVVIPDIRFPNEVKAVHRWNGKVVRIDAYERLDNSDDHRSETALDGFDNFDWIMDNNGSLEEFNENIERYAEGLL